MTSKEIKKEYEYLLKIPALPHLGFCNISWYTGMLIWRHILALSKDYGLSHIDKVKSIIIAKKNANAVVFYLYVRNRSGLVTRTILGEIDGYDIELFPKEYQKVVNEKGEILMKCNPL